jgi:hypothetical protein
MSLSLAFNSVVLHPNKMITMTCVQFGCVVLHPNKMITMTCVISKVTHDISMLEDVKGVFELQ